MTEPVYDLIVIGSGQGGTPLSSAFARAGQRVLLVERGDLGGTCVNVGCTPTKTMIASAHMAYVVQGASRMGVVGEGVSRVDMRQVRDRMRAMVAKFRDGTERSLAAANVEIARGTGMFVGPKRLRIHDAAGEERTVRGEVVVIDTGTRNVMPPVDGLDTVNALDSTSIMQLDVVPGHLLVMGGGYVGLEFAQMFRRFGSAVTIVQHDPMLLPREDSDVVEAVTSILREDGIDVVTSATVTRVSRGGDGMLQLWYRAEASGAEIQLSGTHLLVATGRHPNTDGLGADAAGVALDEHGFVTVDERLATTADGVFAIGDVTGGPAFTHVAYDDYRILRENLLHGASPHGASRTTRGRIVPYTMFIDPQLGRVGMTEHEARASGANVRIACLPMRRAARALETDETRGFMKAVVDAESGMILGASILGAEGGEVATVIQVAMMAGMSYTALRDGMFSHPTFSESLNNLFMALDA